MDPLLNFSKEVKKKEISKLFCIVKKKKAISRLDSAFMASCSTTSYHACKKKVSNYAKIVETYVANTSSS